MTTTEGILAAGLLLNLICSVWLWGNHKYSARAERAELFRRVRKLELSVARILTRLEMKEEGDGGDDRS